MIPEIARGAILAALGVLYGLAYAVIGYNVGAAIDATDIGTPGLYAWLFVWVAAGAVGLTIWTLRAAEIDVRRRDRNAGPR